MVVVVVVIVVVVVAVVVGGVVVVVVVVTAATLPPKHLPPAGLGWRVLLRHSLMERGRLRVQPQGADAKLLKSKSLVQ